MLRMFKDKKDKADKSDKKEKKHKKDKHHDKHGERQPLLSDAPISSPISFPKPNPHLTKLGEIRDGIDEIALDSSLKQPALLKIEAIRQLIETGAAQADIIRELKVLDEIVLELRRQNVEKQKSILVDKVDAKLREGEDLDALQQRAEDLGRMAQDTFTRTKPEPVKKRGGFFSSCFPCCCGSDTDEEPEKRSLLSHQ